MYISSIYFYLEIHTHYQLYIYISIFLSEKNPRTFFETVKHLRSVPFWPYAAVSSGPMLPPPSCPNVPLWPELAWWEVEGITEIGPPKKRCRIILNQASHWKRCKHCEKSGRVNLRIMIPKKHILQYLEVDFNIFPMISTIYDQLKIHTMECLRPQRWSGGTGGTEVPPA